MARGPVPIDDVLFMGDSDRRHVHSPSKLGDIAYAFLKALGRETVDRRQAEKLLEALGGGRHETAEIRIGGREVRIDAQSLRIGAHAHLLSPVMPGLFDHLPDDPEAPARTLEIVADLLEDRLRLRPKLAIADFRQRRHEYESDLIAFVSPDLPFAYLHHGRHTHMARPQQVAQMRDLIDYIVQTVQHPTAPAGTIETIRRKLTRLGHPPRPIHLSVHAPHVRTETYDDLLRSTDEWIQWASRTADAPPKIAEWSRRADMLVDKRDRLDGILVTPAAEIAVRARAHPEDLPGLLQGDYGKLKLSRDKTHATLQIIDGVLRVHRGVFAKGVSWRDNDDNSEIELKNHLLPETAIASLKGRPLSDLIVHPLMPTDATILDVRARSASIIVRVALHKHPLPEDLKKGIPASC